MLLTGFSIVLWSRLHLVINDPKLLKAILGMTLINGLVCHTPVVVFEFGLISRHHAYYMRPMEIMERIQQTIFTTQETVISSSYTYYAARLLSGTYAARVRNIVASLVCVQLIAVGLDIFLTVLYYHNMFTLKCTIHPFVYSIKLKLEFIVLNQLQTVIKQGISPGLTPKSEKTTASQVGFPREPESWSSDRSPFSRSKRFEPKPAHEFITQSDQARQQHVGNISMVKSVYMDIESVRADLTDSDQIFQATNSDELDLNDIIGSPEEEPIDLEIDDLERRYLGRRSV